MPGKIFSLLLTLFTSIHSINVKQGHQEETRESCARLQNHETYSSVKVAIGSPPQMFNLVADTGSNSCIVKDCACKSCPSDWGKCFTGPDRSRSFVLPTFAVKNASIGNDAQVKKAPAAVVLSFGSGEIAAQIASDEVRVGKIKAFMDNGLLLMVDHALNLQGQFEGILGLGRPDFKAKASPSSEEKAPSLRVPGFFDQANVQRFSMCFNREEDGVLGINTPLPANPLSSVGKLHWGLDFHGISIGDKETKVTFCDPNNKKPGMQTACGIIPDSGTTLIAGAEKQINLLFEELCKSWSRCQETHKQLQQELKELKNKGIKIDQGLDPMALLQDKKSFWDMAQKVAGGRGLGLGVQHQSGHELAGTQGHELAGTQGFLGNIKTGQAPQGIDAGAAPEHLEFSEALTLQLLLEHCSEWIKDVDLDHEMPKMTFHVAGANGNKEKLLLNPKTYVLAREMEVEVPSVSKVFGFPMKTKQTSRQKVCMMAFSPIEYKTELNGDVWIMGTPLFYEYTAHYNRGTGPEQEVTMGFTSRKSQECGHCEGYEIRRHSGSLLASENMRSPKAEKTSGLDSLNELTKTPVVRNLTLTHSL